MPVCTPDGSQMISWRALEYVSFDLVTCVLSINLSGEHYIGTRVGEKAFAFTYTSVCDIQFTWSPAISSDRYFVLPSASKAYEWTGPAFTRNGLSGTVTNLASALPSAGEGMLAVHHTIASIK